MVFGQLFYGRCTFVLDKLSGLRFSTSHAVKVGSPVTFELVPIMHYGDIVESSSSAETNDVHYLWLFGDEVSRNLVALLFYGFIGDELIEVTNLLSTLLISAFLLFSIISGCQ